MYAFECTSAGIWNAVYLSSGGTGNQIFQEYTKQRSEQEIEKKQWRAKRVKGYLAGFAISFSLTLTAHFYDTIPAGVLCVGIAVGFSACFLSGDIFGESC